MIFQAVYDDKDAVIGATVDGFALEHTWGVVQLEQEPHLKATKARVTVTASGYVATYDVVKRTKTEIATRLHGIRKVAE